MAGTDTEVSRTQETETEHGKAPVLFGKKEYVQINSTINFADTPNVYWSSLGMGKDRERLLCDKNSPFLKLLLVEIKRELNSKEKAGDQHSIADILNLVCNKIRDLNEPSGNVVRRLIYFLNQQKRSNEGYIDIQLDTLILHKLLVCRHKALICSLILGSLVQEGFLPDGIVRQYRASYHPAPNLQIGHCWTVYRELASNTLWICDPTWMRVDSTNPDFSSKTIEKYQGPILETMKNKLNTLDTPLCLSYKIKQTKSFSDLLSLISHHPTDISEKSKKRIESFSCSIDIVHTLAREQYNKALSFITRDYGLREKCDELQKKGKLSR